MEISVSNLYVNIVGENFSYCKFHQWQLKRTDTKIFIFTANQFQILDIN